MFCVVAQELKLKPGRARKLTTGFGGGIARQGLVCGALSGAAMAAGLALGGIRPGDKEAKDRVYSLVADLENDFLKKAGAFNCKEITGLDFRDPGDRKRYSALSHRNVCTPIVTYMVRRTVTRLKEKGGGRKR